MNVLAMPSIAERPISGQSIAEPHIPVRSNAMSPTPEQNEINYLGKIPIKNIWLLMLYASDLYRHLDSKKIAVEDNLDDIADLVAEILCDLVKKRLMRNLSYGYQNQVATLSRVRGRIDMLYTEAHNLLEKGKVYCHFEELTIDTPRNRYVRAALEKLSILVRKNKVLAHKCKTLVINLDRLGVTRFKPIGYSSKSERFGHHDREDQKMVFAADLAFLLALPTELKGKHHLIMPDNDISWLRKLFEKAIAGFYKVTLENNDYEVLAGKHLDWQISSKTAGIDAIMPSMITDIIIKEKSSGKRLIIDTKFNEVIIKGQYDKNRLRSAYLYQMYAYLRSQEKDDEPQSFASYGMLLHPAVGTDFNESITIQGHIINFCTVNLTNDAIKIREQLLNILVSTFNQ